jgi:acetylornithine deacetylase
MSDAAAWLERLVAFDTTSRNSNLALIEDVAGYLRQHGIASSLLKSPDGAKANLFATIGPMKDGGIVLSGHTDVVPVDGQPWDTDPFRLTRMGSRWHGRGTSDMKAFAACALALLPEMLAQPLDRPIHLALSYDEEVGCTGVGPMIEHIISASPARPAIVIVGEPTEMTVVNAHKGIACYCTLLTGHEAHSSLTHKGVNAIEYAVELIAFLQSLGREMQARGDPHGRFDPPYTTVHVGTIQGGTAQNIIPRSCRFTWEYREIPGTGGADILARFRAHAETEVLPRMQAVAPDAAIVTETTAEVAPLLPEDGSPAETLVLALARQNRSFAVSYGTEGGLFQRAGLPTVVCGPGSIAQAHQPNEFIEASQIDACCEFLRRVIEHSRKG